MNALPKSRAPRWFALRRRKLRPIVVAASLLASIGLALAAPSEAGSATPEKALFTSSFSVCYRAPALINSKGALTVIVERRFGYEKDVAAAADLKPARRKVQRCTDSGSIDLVARRSTDGGETWSDLSVVVDHKTFMTDGYTVALAGNATLAPAGDDNVLLVFSVNRSKGPRNSIRCVRFKASDRAECDGVRAEQALWMSRSADGGRSWSKAEPLTFVGPSTRIKQPGPGHGVRLASGRIVVPAYPRLLLSDDGGRTWREGATTHGEGALQGGETVIGSPDGVRLVASLRPTGAAFQMTGDGRPYRISAVSLDGGETYASVTRDDDLSIPPVTPGFLVDGPVQALSHPTSDGPTNGRAKGRDRKDLTLSVSRDDGRTWSSCLIDRRGAGYSDLALVRAGQVAMVFEGALAPKDDYRAAIKFRALPLQPAGDICLRP
ncbi:sialidase family protein [Methylopila turkensis]|uniref:exo-alpha-sialidase n=1 Tax=Methylopila turkensis TaxID=1437816 RepID=A0A9W6JNM4_9HYPH|nr:sialidase family protein [Methylopila turkensis]GLK79686.1 hypothetical protein GCM10008174_14270 [Methylopila turkensis]